MITEVIKITADTSDATPKIDKLDSSLNNLNSTNKGVAKGMKESTNSVLENGGAMGILNDLTGGLAMTIKDGVEAMVLFSKESKIATLGQSLYASVVGTSTGAMKLFRLALAGTGIGLLVLALVSLVMNFGKVTDAVTKFLPGLKMVGDFFKTVSNAVTDFVGITSEAERELEKFNEQAKKSLKQNEDYLQTRGDLLDKFSTKKVEAKNKYLKALEEENLSDTKRLELQKRLNRDLANIDKERNEDRAKSRKEAQDKIDAENKRIQDAQKSKQDKIDAQNKKREDERISKFNEDRKKLADESFKFQDEQETLRIEREVREDKAKESFMLTDLERRQRGAEAIRLANEKEAETQLIFEENVQKAKLDIVDNTISLIGMLAKKGSALAKGIAIANVIREQVSGISGIISNTALANAKAVASSPTTLGQPFVALNTISAGLGIAGSVAGAVRAIKDINSESKTAGGATLPQSGGGAPSAPSFNLVQGTGANQIASSLATQNKPIQAYVVSTNVTTAQSLDRNIIQNSKI